MADIAASTAKSRIDVGLISDEPELIERTQAICATFGFGLQHWPSLEAFLEGPLDCRVTLASLKAMEQPNSAAELAQAVRFASQDTFLICCVRKTLGKEAAQFAKKSGANTILLKEEIQTTTKIEFACLQVIRSSYLPIKASDLIPDMEMTFDVYHLLPLRKKFLKFIFTGDRLDPAKIAKCKEVNELYISRDSAEAFKKTVEARNDRSAAGLARRCRSQYLALYSAYAELVLSLTDQSEYGSFKEGQEFLSKCRKLCDELLGVLGEFGDAFEVINSSSIGELGTAERGTTVAAYAGLYALKAGLSEIDDIMLAALLSDLGLLLLPPEIARLIREDRLHEMTESQRKEYRTYPNRTLEICLDRKLSMTEQFRTLLTSSNERADATGFPKAISGTAIPIGAQIIQFCRDLDRRTVLRLGHPRVNRKAVLDKMRDEDQRECSRYTATFWASMANVIKEDGSGT